MYFLFIFLSSFGVGAYANLLGVRLFSSPFIFFFFLLIFLCLYLIVFFFFTVETPARRLPHVFPSMSCPFRCFPPFFFSWQRTSGFLLFY
ncbi:hypothetical protein TRSC58_07629 [Trypanosoma rangeli SC58]|uniref:Uncharacterized protein n=1 Tax=Trypanosoma rangeli SC58 TaxID=429131 RepID=A0A061IRR9_TRYRA|nr:hypothetical protein TRSC58_07629 [Trypanosoma rangeli SC58]